MVFWGGLALAVLTYLAIIVTDVDYGWHYKLGEIISQTGIVRKDTFTYSMPSYPFVDYEWGSNLIVYWGERLMGRNGAAGLWAGLAMACWWIVIPRWGKKYWWWATFLGLAVAVGRFAIRPQVISWILTAAVLRLLYDESLKPRRWWMFMTIMWMWANLHGSYFVGLGLWGVWWGVRMLREKRLYPGEILVGAAGIVMTSINPYGIGNWREVLMQMGQAKLFAATLEEWQPAWAKVDLGMVAMVAWLVGVGIKFKKVIKAEEAAIVAFGMVAGISSLRHGVLAMVIASPLAIRLWIELEKEIMNRDDSDQRWTTFVKSAGILAFVLFCLEAGLVLVNQTRVQPIMYPVAAVEYLKTHEYSGRLFASYAWGGYLIRALPSEKIFVDGRMSGWWWDAPPGESDHAYREYLKVMGEPDEYADEVLNRYGVKTFLLRKVWTGKSEPSVIQQWLVKSGWRIVYEDRTAIIFRKG